jgi:hypothetical protein
MRSFPGERTSFRSAGLNTRTFLENSIGPNTADGRSSFPEIIPAENAPTTTAPKLISGNIFSVRIHSPLAATSNWAILSI